MRVLTLVAAAVFGITLNSSAQTRSPSPAPLSPALNAHSSEAGRRGPSFINQASATTQSKADAAVPHPDEIQAKLKLLADQLNEAGLPDEARSLAVFEQRLRALHYAKLMMAYQKSLQNQIALKVQIVEMTSSCDVSELFPNERTGMRKTSRSLSGILPPEKLDKWIVEQERQSQAKLVANQQMTILNGQTAVFQNSKEPAPMVQPGAERDSTAIQKLPALDLVASAKADQNRLIKLNVSAESSQSILLRIQSEVEVREGQSLVLLGIRRSGVRTEVSRVPVLGDVPVVGPSLFSSKKTYQEDTELMFVVTPQLVTPALNFAVQPAAYTQPVR